MPFQHTFTADGYSNCFYVSGGTCEVRATYTAGTGTVSLLRANQDAVKNTAASYAAFHADTTFSGTGVSGAYLGEGLYCFQLSSGSTPNITAEVAKAESGHVEIKEFQIPVA